MTEYMIQAVENNIDVEPADLVPIIREEIQADVRVMLQSMPVEMVEQFLGQEVINTLRKSRVAAAKKAPVPVKSAVKDIGKPVQKKPEAPKKPVTIKDFFGV
jgi:hypothetical protein